MAIYGQESYDTIQVNNGEELKYPKFDKNIFLKTMNSHLFLEEASRYKENNSVLIDDSPEKSILNNTGNVVFLKSWKHTIKNCSSNNYLCTELALLLERLYKEGWGDVAQFVNRNRLGVNPLVPDDTMYELIMNGLKKTV